MFFKIRCLKVEGWILDLEVPYWTILDLFSNMVITVLSFLNDFQWDAKKAIWSLTLVGGPGSFIRNIWKINQHFKQKTHIPDQTILQKAVASIPAS